MRSIDVVTECSNMRATFSAVKHSAQPSVLTVVLRLTVECQSENFTI